MQPLGAVLWIILCGYYVAAVMLHEAVQQALLPLFTRWSYFGYEQRLVILWFVAAAPLAAVVTVGLYRGWGWRGVAGWAALVGTICAVDHWLLFSQSERVHYPQYMVLYLGLRYLSRSPVAALAMAAVAGVGDEAYQRFVLYGDRPELSLDFKDMGLNLLGALLGLCLWAAVGALRRARSRGLSESAAEGKVEAGGQAQE